MKYLLTKEERQVLGNIVKKELQMIFSQTLGYDVKGNTYALTLDQEKIEKEIIQLTLVEQFK